MECNAQLECASVRLIQRLFVVEVRSERLWDSKGPQPMGCHF